MSLLKLKKNKIVLSILLLLFLTPVIVPFFHGGIPDTHDGMVQVARFAAYQKAFYDGHIPPRWAGDLNYRYGIPVFNFYYPLPGYSATVLSLFGISMESGFKILSLLSIGLSIILMYSWIKTYTSQQFALFLSFLYALAPYQLLNLFVRGDIGESLALALLPGCLWGFDQIKTSTTLQSISLTGLCLTCFLLAHHGIALMMTPLLLGYLLIQTKTLQNGIRFVITMILGYGGAAFFLIPAWTEQKYTLATTFIGDMFRSHFLSLDRLFFHSWGFGADVNTPGGQAPQLGLLIGIGLFVSVFIRRKTTQQIKILRWFFFLIASAGIILSLPMSEILWNHVSILQKYQFPWRFLALATFGAVAFLGMSLNKLSRSVLIPLWLLLFTTTIVLAHPKGYIHQTPEFYRDFPATTFFHGETTPIWSAGTAGDYPSAPIELIGGSATISGIARKTHQLTATISDARDAQLLLNTLFYPGWIIEANRKELPIQFQDPNHRGLMTVHIPNGTSTIQARFIETRPRKIADILSLISLATLVSLFIIGTLRNRKKETI